MSDQERDENVASFNVANFQLGIGIEFWQHFHIGNIFNGSPGLKPSAGCGIIKAC